MNPLKNLSVEKVNAFAVAAYKVAEKVEAGELSSVQTITTALKDAGHIQAGLVTFQVDEVCKFLTNRADGGMWGENLSAMCLLMEPVHAVEYGYLSWNDKERAKAVGKALREFADSLSRAA